MIKVLKLFICYLILLLVAFYSYFFAFEGYVFFSMFDLCIFWFLCIFVLSMLQEMYEFKITKAFLEILKLYLYLFIFVYVIYSLLNNYEWLWYVLLCLILLGIYLDHRIIGWRYLAFSVFVLLHFIVIWNGWMNTEVLIIRDLFWYSLIMLGSFVWHVVILNWLSKLMEYLKLDYMSYVISRWSLLTSLTLIWLILQWSLMIIRYFWSFTDRKKINRLMDEKEIYLFFYIIIYSIFLVIQYFCIVFNNYSNLLLGIGNKINIFEIPLKIYLFMIVTFIMSIWLYIPRIYLIWIIMLSMNIGVLAKKTILYLKSIIKSDNVKYNNFIWDLLWDCWRNFIMEKYRDIRSVRINNRSEWKGDRYLKGFFDLYEIKLFRDYVWFVRELDWGIDNENVKGVYDIFEIFIYSKDREARILSKILRGYAAQYTSYFFTNDIDYNRQLVRYIWEDWSIDNRYYREYSFEEILRHMPIDDNYDWVIYVTSPGVPYRKYKSAMFIFWKNNINKIFA